MDAHLAALSSGNERPKTTATTSLLSSASSRTMLKERS